MARGSHHEKYHQVTRACTEDAPPSLKMQRHSCQPTGGSAPRGGKNNLTQTTVGTGAQAGRDDRQGKAQLQGQGAVARGALTAREGGQAQLRCRRRQRGLDATDR